MVEEEEEEERRGGGGLYTSLLRETNPLPPRCCVQQFHVCAYINFT